MTMIKVEVQKPFSIREFTLDELSKMATSTSNEQTPVNPKIIEGLCSDFLVNPMVKPFSVALFDEVFYLVGGRHRRYAHIQLGRPGHTKFQCIFYEVETAAKLNELIIQDNASRRSTGTEKRLLRLGGELNLVIGTDDLKEVYEGYLKEKNTKGLVTTLKTDIVARLLNADKTNVITEVMMPQLVNAVWVNTLGLKKYSNYLYLLTFDIQNVSAYIDMTVRVLTESFKHTIDSNHQITRWARDGKPLLVDRASAAMREELPGVWKVLPPKTTSKRHTSNTAVATIKTQKSPEATSKVNDVPVVAKKVKTTSKK